jgi:hypothetical protein
MVRSTAALSFVISTGAYPDFLLHAASDNHVCGFPQENRMILINATALDRKSGGAQWRDLCVDALSWRCVSTKTA